MLQKKLELRLSEFRDPYLNAKFNVNWVKNILIDQDIVRVELLLDYPCDTIRDDLVKALKEWLAQVAEKTIDIKLAFKIDAHNANRGITGLANVKNIIAIGSGKGGVGKSTVAVNVALALAKEGAQVGLLDADIYGPSQPAMLGTQGQKPVVQDKSLQPIVQHNIQSMSIGYLIDETAPMIWRGPMIGKALQQLLEDTSWNNLDYLIVDLPPGTGDVQLTLCQKIPVSGAVIVTTPQDLALLDVRRAIEMFNKLNVPVLGIVENMSMHQCRQCGHQEPIFGVQGARKLSEQYAIDIFGSIPLDASIREMTDNGQPPAIQNNLYSKLMREIALRIASKLTLQAKDYSVKFPKIVVQNK